MWVSDHVVTTSLKDVGEVQWVFEKQICGEGGGATPKLIPFRVTISPGENELGETLVISEEGGMVVPEPV